MDKSAFLCSVVDPVVEKEVKLFSCDICQKVFSRKDNKRRHEISQHSSNYEKLFSCDICQKTFHRKYGLRVHIMTHQKGFREKENSQIKCFHCLTNFRTRRELLIHYTNDHGENLVEETVRFSSQSEFKEWKKQVEKEDQCQFVSSRGAKRGKKGSMIRYLLCHRDGFYKSSVNLRQKKLKSQGTNKISGSCAAQMIATEDSDGMVTVRYIRAHINHSSNTGRLNLSVEERASIAGEISEGVPFDEILNRTRDSAVDVGESSKLACLTRQDLRNIRRDFNLYSCHELVDFTSVQLWYEKVSHLADDLNPVIYFKPPGTDGCEESSLELDDILLIIATKYQISTLQQFGSNVICVDSIPGTEACDFHLTSIVVVDDYGNAIPAAFCISNKRDADTWTIFFKKLYELVGVIYARVFMSDTDNSFYQAWVFVMVPATTRLQCAWHVDHEWRTNLQALVKDREVRALVYKQLRVILKEVRVENFHSLLDDLTKQIEEDDRTAQFAAYFERSYANRVTEWAYCYRQFGDAKTNTCVENLHKEFRQCYSLGRKTKRLDKCIDGALKVARDQIFKRELKMGTTRCLEREEAIRLSHLKATIDLKATQIREVSSSVWTVSSSGDENVYEVTKMADNSKVCFDGSECLQRCDECAICVHSYGCDCVDYVINDNICEHIHACVLTSCLCSEDVEYIIECETEPEILSLDDALLPAESQSTVKSDLFESTLEKMEAVFGYLRSMKKEDFSDEQLLTITSYVDKMLDIATS